MSGSTNLPVDVYGNGGVARQVEPPTAGVAPQKQKGAGLKQTAQRASPLYPWGEEPHPRKSEVVSGVAA